MSISAKTLSFKNNIDSTIAAVIGFCVIYTYTSYSGIGVSPDSVAYASVARFLQKGLFFIQFDRMPLIVFPFFYPTFLSGIMSITGLDVFATAPVVNALLFAALVFMTGCIAEQFADKNKWCKWILLSVLLLSTSLTEIFCMLWSESLFIVLFGMFMISLRNYFSQYKVKALVLAAFIAALACVTRFAGVTFIGAGGLMLLIDKDLPWKKKWWHLLVFGITSISLLIANLIQNYFTEGTLTGDRQKGVTPLAENIQYASNVLWDWFQLPQTGYGYVSVIVIGLVLLFIFVVFKRWKRNLYFHSYENIAAVFFIIYTSFIVITATLSRYETINNRLLSPAYIALLLGVGALIAGLFKQRNKMIRQWMIIICALLLFCSFQYKQAANALQWYAEIKSDGIPGYNQMAWKRSPIIRYLHEHKNDFNKNAPLYSNANDAVYFFTDLCCETVPEAVHTAEVRDYYKMEPHYIVWFNNEYDNTDILRPEEIKKHRTLDTLFRFADGMVFWSR